MDVPAERLHSVLRRIRKPAALKNVIAQCLRHVYMGDPFSAESDSIPRPPAQLLADVQTKELSIEGCRCVVYTPKSQSPELFPGLLYMHGGGFVIGCIEDTDYTTRKLCLDNQAVVVSVDYPLAPEAMFPEALQTCRGIWNRLKKHGRELQIDPAVMYAAGDSAGGNLAAGVALAGGACGLIMLAPWLDMNVESYESYNQLAPDGIVFDAAFIGYARAAYARHHQWCDPDASPIFAEPALLPPVFITAGTDDPLYDQSDRFCRRLRETKTDVKFLPFPDMPHCFYAFPGLYAEELHCYEAISKFIERTKLPVPTSPDL